MSASMKNKGARRAMLAAALLLGGCNTYSYLDFQTTIDPTWGSLAAQVITSCHMFVTGAVTDNFNIPDTRPDGTPLCPPDQPALNITRINYSTFAESGDVTFTLKAFISTGEKPECEVAEGATTIPIVKGSTKMGGDLVLKAKAHDACPN